MILPCGLGADNLGMSFLMPGAHLIRAPPSPGTISRAYSKVMISWEAIVNWKRRSGTTHTGAFRTSPFLPFPDAFIHFKPLPNQQITKHCNVRKREKRSLFFLWAFPTAPRIALHRLPRSRAGTRTTPWRTGPPVPECRANAASFLQYLYPPWSLSSCRGDVHQM